MPEQDTGTLQSSQRQVRTAISTDIEMSIRRTDWRRVYRKVKTIPRETSVYEVVENVAWGVAGSAILSLIPLYQATQGADAWVRPTFITVAVAALIVGGLSHHFASSRRELIASSCAEVLEDMREVHQTFFPSDDL